jgi:SAM-dependent methyltransferase
MQETLKVGTGGLLETTTRKTCPLCEAPTLEPFFDASEMPVQLNALWSTRDEALQCPGGRIQLAFCANCGCITNVAFEPGCVVYDVTYENSLHFSPSFQEYAQALVKDLVGRHNLRDKVIVEIGCGKGEFLAMLCRFGNNRGIGFDPACEDARGDTAAGRGIKFVKEPYSDAHAGYSCDFLCCRHVLEHMPDPKEFLSSVRRAVNHSPHSVLFFEVPNALFVLGDAGMWDVTYPHCFYYAPASLRLLFTSCGFDVMSLQESFGGQYLCIEALPGQAQAGSRGNGNDANELQSLEYAVREFGENYARRAEELSQILIRLQHSGKRAALWGAGAKGISFLNKFRHLEAVECVVDINPNKHGKFVSGTGQQIMPPDFLKVFRPDAIVVTNPRYCEEIARQLQCLGLQPSFILS